MTKFQFSLGATLTAAASVAAITFATGAMAQNAPGVPDGILSTQFQLNPHPQMQFAASAPTAKYQNKVTAARKRADDGDPDGCNLKCPQN
jgi:hypothetical protein